MKKFRCIAKRYADEKHHKSLIPPYEQALLYNNGVCKVGIDLWRLLDKSDFPSYDIHVYGDLDGLKEDYYIVSKSGKILWSDTPILKIWECQPQTQVDS